MADAKIIPYSNEIMYYRVFVIAKYKNDIETKRSKI